MRLKIQIPQDSQHYQKPNKDDCGPKCLEMIRDAFYPQTRGQRLKNSKGKFIRGRKQPEQIKQLVEDMGLACEEFSTKNMSREKGEDFLKSSIRRNRPVIVFCRAKCGKYPPDYHYIIVTAIDKNRVWVRDPYPKRKSILSLNSFFTPRTDINWGETSRWGIAIYTPRKKQKP